MDWKLKIFYDGQCPFCKREIAFMQRRDREAKLIFADITAPDFDAGEHGLELHQLQSVIHAVTPEGQVLTRMSVFRAAYREIGLGWIVACTKWPILETIFDWAYAVFAKHRVKIGNCLSCAQLKPQPNKHQT